MRGFRIRGSRDGVEKFDTDFRLISERGCSVLDTGLSSSCEVRRDEETVEHSLLDLGTVIPSRTAMFSRRETLDA